MTTPTNPNQPVGDSDDLLAMPAYATPWVAADFRDENARLLVDAIYRHRESLLRDSAFVPIQGYEVLPPDVGPSGAVNCGVLISLWRGSALCRGECPVCKGLALAMAFGGGTELWLVTGVCRQCGFLTQRTGTRADIIGELDRGLEGTRYTLPSDDQFMSSNGHQHLALLTTLTALGEVLLPPAHYGLAASSSEQMRVWVNPFRARARHWAWCASVRHVPTGARVEKTDAVYELLMNFVLARFMESGTLPELDHDGPNGLRYCFPMISQDAVVLPQRPAEERPVWEDDDEEDEDERKQASIDALVESWRAGALDKDALQRVTDALDEQGVAYDGSYGDPYGVFLSPEAIARAYEMIDEDELRGELEITTKRITRAQRIEYLEQCVLPSLLEDADITRLFSPVVLKATSGHGILLVAMVHGYSFSGVETEWMGPFGPETDFAVQLRKEGWIERVEEFQKLSLRRKREIVTGA
jgi:hypothetical protein